MRALLIALQLLTRLPVPLPAECTPRDRGRSVLYYPVVGLLIGALLWLLNGALGQSDAGVRAALLLVVWVLLTGGLHIDGLADSADAWLGGHGDRQRSLDIMQDPRSGPAAVMLVTLVLLVKFATLAALLAQGAWSALFIAPLLGRAALVGVLLTTPYVRANGLGAEPAQQLPRRSALYVLILCAVAIVSLEGGSGVLLLAVASVGVFLLRRMMQQRLGGTTGDTLGATCEITEALVLVTLSLLGDT
jgi:adenosylcobinamide-GDP ribazoletransferase